MNLVAKSMLHVLKVPSTIDEFFPYSHYADEHSIGPTMECYYENPEKPVILLITGLAKLKPNVQTNKKLRIDIYGPHSSLLDMAYQLTKIIGVGNTQSISKADPEAARVGMQTLPKMDKSFRLQILSVEGNCAGFKFGGATSLFFDHERPDDGHIEMVGPEFHLGIPLQTLSGSRNDSLLSFHDVPQRELRVKGEQNPVAFSTCNIKITMTVPQASIFFTTVQNTPVAQ